MSEIRILYVDDYPLDRELVRDALEKEHGGFRVTEAASRADLEARLAEGDFDLVLSDFNILGFEGLQVIETVHAKDPRIPVVIVTGTGSEEIAVEALKRGAADYVIKTPKHIRRLPQTIHTALEKKKLVEERTHAEQERDRLFNYSIDLLCIAGFDGYFKQLNPAWGRTLGWTNDELMSKPYIEFVHPDDRQATTQAAGSLVDGNLVYSFENRYRCRDGKYKWLSWNSYPLADEDLIFAVAHDVTNRKQSDLAEHAARIHAETLAAASHALTQSLELESVLDTLLEHLRRVVPYDGANIMLLENESHLRIRSARGYEKLGGLENIRAMAFDAHNTPNLWKVMQTKQSCVVNDTHTEPGWIFLEGVEHVRSWLGVPLIVNDHIIGMYSLDKAEPDYFTPKEIRLVESLAPQAAVAIRNANLFETIRKELNERQRAEESLRESDEKFSKAFHSNPAMLVLTTLDGKNVDVNQAYVDFLGYSREEILGKSVTDLQIVSMEERQKILELIQRAGGSLHNAEIAVQVRGGSLRHILLSADVISLGSVPHRLTTLLDITERKQAEESLRQAEKKYRNIFENTVEAIHQTTLDGKYIIANPATARILGYDSPEDLMININDLNAQFYVQAGRREEFKRLMETHDTISDFESEVYRKDGSKIWVSEKVHTVRDNVGTPLFYEGTSLDITERKRNEERIRQQLARLTALSLIDQAITATFELRITLDIFLEHVTTQLHVDAAAVLLHNPTMHTLEFKAGKGFHGTGMTKLNLRLGESYAGKAALERHMISVPDITKADPPFTRSHLIAGEGFIAFYAVPLIAKGQIKGALEVFHRARFNPDQEWLDFLNTLAGQAAIAIDNAELFNKLHRSNAELMRAYDATIEGWSRALDLRDKETEGHTQRVTEMTLRLAEAMGQSDEELIQIRRGALLHDIGKLGVPDGILLKPDTLTDDEWVVMKKHAQYAYDMLLPIDYLRHALDIPYCHHEKWDGTGYPRGLKGEEIPLAARIFAVVDVWDALRSDRPYRKGWSEGDVRQHIRQQSGAHFDPQVVDVFLKLSV